MSEQNVQLINSDDYQVIPLRRLFLKGLVVSPLLCVPTTSEAILPIIGLGIEAVAILWRARSAVSLVRTLVGAGRGLQVTRGVASRVGVSTIRNTAKDSAKSETKKKVTLEDIANVTKIAANTTKTAVNIRDLMKDEKPNVVWKSDTSNKVTASISNPENEHASTGKMEIKVEDKYKGDIDIGARIDPITIPPKSDLILDIGIHNPDSFGAKRLSGTYANGQRNFQSDGDIIIPALSCNGKLDQVEEFMFRDDKSKALELINMLGFEVYDSCDASAIAKYKHFQSMLRNS